jgi:hypothetical protein
MKENKPLSAHDFETKEAFLETIKIPHERAFAEHLLTHNHLDIYYEPKMFRGEYNGNPHDTKPDFFVRNMKNEKAQGTYIELTTGEYVFATNTSLKKDPKKMMKHIMKKHDERYVVLYRQHLVLMERTQGIDFELPEESESLRNQFSDPQLYRKLLPKQQKRQ